MRALAVTALMVLAAACQSSTEPVSSVSPPVPLTKLSFTCKLPVATSNAPLDGVPGHGATGQGGFMSFPDGKFTRDPASMGSYDAAVGKWLPVPRAWVSADGSRYAFVTNDPDPVIHIVDAASGSEQTTELTSVWHVATAARQNLGPMQVATYDKAGVFLQKIHPNSDRPPDGLALFVPGSNTFENPVISDGLGVIAVHNGYAYTGNDATGYDSIPPDGFPPYFNELFAWGLNYADPNNPSQTSVLFVKDAWLRVVGYDAGDEPLISASSATSYRILSGSMFTRSAPNPVFTGKPKDLNNPIALAVGDTHGNWFPSTSGVIWYYAGHNTPFAAAAVAPFRSPIIAGRCV